MYKFIGGEPLVLLVHPGGPFWSKKDLGSWSIPKGEYKEGEDPQSAAFREFGEETGADLTGKPQPLGAVRQSSQKTITAWAVEGDFDPAELRSNSFELEWPPKSGQLRQFPEADAAAWFTIDEARRKIIPGQSPFLDRLMELISLPG